MSDKQNKASDHLPDPLDYLYEELSPKGMAETRLHLGECPSCREEMIKTREAVKQYRQTSRPVPPSGLAARTAAKALAEARRARLPAGTGYTGPLEHPPVPVRPAGGLDEQEFIRLKEEILGEIRENRRSWLFHPAWTVAASVVFICAVLIHVSPRSNLWLSGVLNMESLSFSTV